MENEASTSAEHVPPKPMVWIVDDNASFRQAMAFLLRGFGYESELFESGETFLDALSERPDREGILLLDVKMQGLSGLDVQEALLTEKSATVPIIFITGHGDVEMAVTAMLRGATTFLQKPVTGPKLLEAITLATQALERAALEQARRLPSPRVIFDSLSQRERQVALLSAQGLCARKISERLGIAIRTAEFHRAAAMKKFHVHTQTELKRILELAKQNP